MQILGGTLQMGQRVTSCSYDAEEGLWTVHHEDARHHQRETQARHVISSAPLKQLAHGLNPPMSPGALRAASALKYRDFLTVVLILKDRQVFTDNWIYIHDPSVNVGRVQNFKSWSPELVPDPALNCYGLEYFCTEKDGLWNSSDAALVEMAKQEVVKIGLARAEDVVDGCVVRQPKAYPVYDGDYAANVAVIREELEDRYPSLHLVGRNGMHKYNNQDHAMMTAMLCVQNIIAGRRVYDLWQVNQDAEYHEAGAAGEQLGTNGQAATPRAERVRGTLSPPPWTVGSDPIYRASDAESAKDRMNAVTTSASGGGS
jgi:protoporphyrinogen oxidase